MNTVYSYTYSYKKGAAALQQLLFRRRMPELKIRVVNVVDLMKLEPGTKHPHGLTDADYQG